MAQFYITEEHILRNTKNLEGETNEKFYDSFDEAILDFNKRIFKIEVTENMIDGLEEWDIRLYGKTENYENLLVSYHTEGEHLCVYREDFKYFLD